MNTRSSSVRNLRPRVSEVEKIISKTPTKRKSVARKDDKANKSASRRLGASSASRRRAARALQQPSSSSSSSDSDSDNDAYAEPQGKVFESEDSMEIDDGVSDIFEEINQLSPGSDKENSMNRRLTRSTTRSAKRDNTMNMMSNMALSTPQKSTNKKKAQSKSKSARNVFATDKNEDGFSVLDMEIQRVQKQIERTPLSSISTHQRMLRPRSAQRTENTNKVTPMKLVSSKTPGGTKRWAKKTVFQDDSDDEVVEKVKPIKLKIKLGQPKTIEETLKELSCRLHLSEIPPKLPCRDYEANYVRGFIEEAIHPKYGESTAMYISGVPGTGKTATVRSVIEDMKRNQKYNEFVYVEVNAMIFRKKVFVEIYNGITQECEIAGMKGTDRIAASTARQKLNTILRRKDKKRPPIVILIDELDGLCTKKQDVLYDIFDWTAIPESRVTVIAISNTLDFPERMLCQRISSRLDKRRLIFQPYEHEQISEIINARLAGSQAIEKEAVQLVARKVAAISGDLRQALDMLRRAIRVAIETKAEKLTLSHVIAAQKAITEPLKSRLVKKLRTHKLMVFRAVLTVMQNNSCEETIFADVYKTYCVLCSTLEGVEPSSDTDVYQMVLQLSRNSLLTLSGGDCGSQRRRIKIGMTRYEAEKCIKEVEDLNKNRN